jgi:hypothetical protein
MAPNFFQPLLTSLRKSLFTGDKELMRSPTCADSHLFQKDIYWQQGKRQFSLQTFQCHQKFIKTGYSSSQRNRMLNSHYRHSSQE